MKKKAIVLLISLFFIIAISTLILKNLDDSNEFINISQDTYNLTQTNITVNNVKDEVLKLFKNKKDNIDYLLGVLPNNLPLNFKNIMLQINITKIEPDELYNLNNPNISDNIDDNMTNNIYYTYDFFSLIKDKNITNFRQIDSLVNEYIFITKDKKILNIKDKFSFLDFNTSIDNNNSNTNIYIKCDYNIDVNGLKSNANMIFKVGDLHTMYFDFYLKN